MSNNLRILKNAISTITCTLPSGFTGTTLLTVSALEFENSVLFQVTGNTVNNNAVFVVSAADNNQIERVYFYQVTSGIISLAIGSYSIETSADIAPMPIISGQVNVNIATDFYNKTDINTYSANTLININSKLPIVTFAAYTGSSLNNYYTKSQDDILFVKFSGLTWSNLLSKPTLFSGAYNSLSGKPTLFSGSYIDLSNKPTLFSGSYIDLTNKPNLSQYLTGVTWSQISSKPTLFSGAYSGLTGKPNLAIYLTGVTWSQVSSKPTLFDGAYASLSGKPTLFSGAYTDLTGKPTLFTGNTFIASGGTRLRLVGNSLTIYSPTGGTSTGGGTWGSITGTLSSQTDLQNALNAKSGTGHTHSIYALKTDISTYTGATATAIGNRLLTSTYSTYTGVTATAIGLKLNTSAISAWALAGTKPAYTAAEVSAVGTTAFNTFSGATLPASYYNKTQINSYTGTTNTAIGNRLLTSTYSTYTGATATAIGNRLLTSAFNTYSGTTLTNINSRLLSSSISSWALAGTKPAYTASEVGAVSTTNFNTYSGTTLPANYYNKTQINSYSGATNTLIGNRLLTSAFNTYSGNTQTAIGLKLATSTYSTYTGATATAIGNRLLTSTYSTYTGATLTAINGKLATAGCAADSAKLNNVTAAGYLLSGGTAKNSTCLNGQLASFYLSTTACAADSAKLNNVAASGYLTTSACAADSAKLNNVLPAGYLLSGGTAKNSLCLGGNLANTYLSTTACAADSAKLNNVLPAGYLLSGSTAKNSLCLGGSLASTYATVANAVTGATNLGTGTGLYTSVSANKIQLKGLKGTGGLSITNDGTSITLSATTVTVSGATTDVFANVTDGQLMYRCGSAICSMATSTFLAAGGTAVCATNSACLGGVLPAGYVTPATLAGVQIIVGCAGTSNGNGVRHGASRVIISNKPTAPVVGLNAACSLSVTQVFEAGIIGYSASAARNLTLPTACGASGLVQALPCAAVGDVFQITVYNTCTFAVTLLGGTNTTIVNTNTITCSNSPRLLNFRVTGIGANAETISVY